MKKALSVLLIAALLLGCLAGCGGSGSSTPASTSTAPASTGGDSPDAPAANVPGLKGPGNVTLKRLSYNIAWDPTTDIMVDILKETTGYDVEYYALPAENADEKLVMEVSGGADYDIVQCSPAQFQTLLSQGALMPLDDLLNAYGQDILAGVSDASWRAVSGSDGQIYGIPYKRPYAQEVNSFMACRWDLMQAAGIEAIPTTIDEFYDCLVKLKETYGDQYIIFSGPYNSATDGLTTWIFPQAIGSAFGIYNDWMVDENGKVYYMTEHENFGAMIEFLLKCQQNGLLDPDWAVNTSSTVQEKFAGGRAIIVHMNRAGLGETTPALLETQGLEYEDIGYIGPLKGADGTCTYMRTEAVNQVSVILRSSQNAADAVNWINLKQQQQLYINIGVEGTHFNYDENGGIDPINPIFTEERGNSYWYIDSTNEAEFAQQWPSRVRKSRAQWEGFAAVTLYANEKTPEIFVENPLAFKPATENYSKYNKTLFTGINDYILQVLAGTKTLDDLPTVVSEWENAGGEKVREELQAWYDGFYK